MPSARLHLVWRNILGLLLYHLMGLQAFYYLVTLQVSWKTFLFGFVISELAQTGITCGAHRLWTHRSYRAKKPLQIFYIICNFFMNQNSIYIWARDHRAHHKFCDTDADPHNITRGFFFAHMGWLMCRKHPEITSKGKIVDMTDLESDKLIMWQHKYFQIFAPICCFLVPVVIPWVCWDEKLHILIPGSVFRYLLSLHITWSVNSIAHMYGTRPYDSKIQAVESRVVSVLSGGEGWHNYHHTFPWDYKTSELGTLSTGWSTFFIDCMAKIGQAYDLKTASKELIANVKKKNGGEEETKKFDYIEEIDRLFKL